MVVDNESRENEGDLIMAGQFATPEKLAFMIKHTSGLICAPMIQERCDTLALPLMVPDNTDTFKTAFTVSVDFKLGTTTGISAFDRAATIRALADPTITDADMFTRPGHVFPLRAVQGGVLKRPGHTEAAVDLCQLCGLECVAVICELTTEDGMGMLRRDGCRTFAEKFGLGMISIEQLIQYRQHLLASKSE